MISQYPSIILTESLNDSPFEAEVLPDSAKPITMPPNRFIADSKLSLVLVEGSKNNEASTLPLSISVESVCSIRWARSRIESNSFLLKCRIEIISFCLKPVMYSSPKFYENDRRLVLRNNLIRPFQVLQAKLFVYRNFNTNHNRLHGLNGSSSLSRSSRLNRKSL